MKIKQVIAAASAAALILSSAVYTPFVLSENYLDSYASEIVQTGGDEKGVKWTLDDAGILTISGKGDMNDTSYGEFSESITDIVFTMSGYMSANLSAISPP